MRTENIKKVIDKYYEELHLPIDKGKSEYKAQVRAAIFSTLFNNGAARIAIVEFLPISRCTTYHYLKNHEHNIEAWKGYKNLCELAERVILHIENKEANSVDDVDDWEGMALRVIESRLSDIELVLSKIKLNRK